MRRRIAIAAIIIAAAIVVVRLIVVASDFSAVVTAEEFESLRGDHTGLRAFLQRMPKGGDLHVHLSGAVYAERLIGWAVQDGLCVRLADASIAEPPCEKEKGTEPIADTLRDQTLYERLVNALSMRFFVPSAATPSGHDQFFAAFGKFGSASGRHAVDMTVDQLRHYQSEAVQYVELMTSFLPGRDRQVLAAAIRGATDFSAMLDTLKLLGLERVVEDMRTQIADQVRRIEAVLDCDAERTRPGCNVRYRYIAQVSRNNPIEDVFVQTAAAAALVRAEPRVVALNFVAPEDYQIAVRDYGEHMRIVGFLAKDVPVALHAGELWLGLVPPSDLASHIRAAVEVAGARRIGHGTALAFERDMEGLLATMRERAVAVEINLTSNDVILGVRGRDHPLPAYLKAGVPVVLSTDDAGVSRIDLSNEYVRAAREHGLGYRALKSIARNALVHAFLPPQERARELERFDRASTDFEQRTTGARWQFRHLVALIKAAVRPRP
ncbi:MAG: adenosine deaminase [Alphaproteobacteria bacterium]|nr:adenosine deaminase [Alphaproteobacteria bacterium]